MLFVADSPFLLAVLLIMSSLLLLTSHKVAAFTAVAGVLLLKNFNIKAKLTFKQKKIHK
jgi:hypothetical protein